MLEYIFKLQKSGKIKKKTVYLVNNQLKGLK